MKNLFNKAKTWGMFEGENPACAVKLLKEPKRRLRFLEAREEATLVEVSPSWLGHLMTIGCNTGLRIGAEFLPLQWPSVDLVARHGHGRSGIQQERREPHRAAQQSSEGSLSSALQMRRGPFVFAKPNGTPVQECRARISKGLQGCRIGRYRRFPSHAEAHLRLKPCHGWRGSGDGAAIWRLVRSVLVQRYAHLSPHHKAKAIEKIAESFHNAIHNSGNSGEVVHLAERRATV